MDYLNDIELTLFPRLENFITWYKISKDQMAIERERIQIKNPLFHKIYEGIEALRILPRNIGIKVSDLKLFNLDELKEPFSYYDGIHGKYIFKEIVDSAIVTFEELYNRAIGFIFSLHACPWPGYPYIGCNYGNEHKKEQYI